MLVTFRGQATLKEIVHLKKISFHNNQNQIFYSKLACFTQLNSQRSFQNDDIRNWIFSTFEDHFWTIKCYSLETEKGDK